MQDSDVLDKLLNGNSVPNLTVEELNYLKQKARDIRIDVVKMLAQARSGHSAGSLGMADIFAVLYFKILKHNPSNTNWDDRDRLVLSNGHICPVLYATLSHAGYFPKEELMTLRKLDSRLQGHPHRSTLPGLETTSGPLGSGLSQACGMAYVAKIDKKNWRTYCLLSDGEHQEGNLWEAVMFASKYKLDNLTVIVDRNQIQISGKTEEVMPLEPLKQKYEAFNWGAIEIDGNKIEDIADAFFKAQSIKNKPTVIIAKTIPGKGVDFMEGSFQWHGIVPDELEVDGAPKIGDQERLALEQLKY